MKNTLISLTEEALDRLGIKYREFLCGEGVLYYCIIPSNGSTFDLQWDDHNIIRLWRFIGTVSLSKAGNRREYRNPQNPCSAIGMEVTDEGDVSFYAEQKIDSTDVAKSAARIERMISHYVDMISDSFLTLALETDGL